jgi:hypothetical protein
MAIYHQPAGICKKVFAEKLKSRAFLQLFSKYFWVHHSGAPKHIWRKVER